MLALRYTSRAEADLDEIAEYTRRTWNERQVERYLDALEKACRRAAEFPSSGRLCSRPRTGIRRIEYESHVIFYRVEEDILRVVRIVHKARLMGLNLD